MTEVFFRKEQVEEISSKLNITKLSVEEIVFAYEDYLIKRLQLGKSVKFLNICFLKRTNADSTIETLAYTSTEISKEFNGRYSSEMILRVLTTFQEVIESNLKKFNGFSIKGLVRIRLVEYGNGYKVRIKKSTTLTGEDVRVQTIGSFRRKVEFA